MPDADGRYAYDMTEPTDDWWNTAGLHTYTHQTHEVEDMGHPHFCLLHPVSGQWFTLRAMAPAKFLDLWDDGLGEPVIPCPGDHVTLPEMDDRGFVVLPTRGGGCVAMTPEAAAHFGPETLDRLNQPSPFARGGIFRLADSVAVRREDIVGPVQPDLRGLLHAEIERPGSVDWEASLPGTYANAEEERDSTYAEMIRQAASAALTTQYEPTGLILHPHDHAVVGATDKIARVPADDPYRRANQKRIADAFGLPYWMVGVDGAKPPIKMRVRRFVRSLPRRVLTTIPGVTYWGPRETGEGWMNAEPAEPRAWLLGVHVGNYRVGTTPHDPWTCGDDDCTEDHG